MTYSDADLEVIFDPAGEMLAVPKEAFPGGHSARPAPEDFTAGLAGGHMLVKVIDAAVRFRPVPQASGRRAATGSSIAAAT